MLLKLEKCIPISHVTLETVPKYANIERPTSSQLYASSSLHVLTDGFNVTKVNGLQYVRIGVMVYGAETL